MYAGGHRRGPLDTVVPVTKAIQNEHRNFERHGDEGAGYARMLGSPQGWPLLLDRFAAACA
jgi:hypothetical protein